MQSQPFHQSQQLMEENTEFSSFELKVLVSEEFIRNLLGYAGEIEVLEPKSLRDAVRERALQLSNLYKKNKS